MKVKATVTTVEYPEVEISASDMITALKNQLLRDAGLYSGRGCYKRVIRGRVEEWCDGHGSGHTTYHGEPTAAQVKAEMLCDYLEKIRANLVGK